MKVKEVSEYSSAKGAIWQHREVDDRLLLEAVQKSELPEILLRILLARGVELGGVDEFMSPTVKNSLPDPFHLLDMDKAVERLVQAVTTGEEIAIFGDYDVDGATSSALLKRFFRDIGSEPMIYIPDRIEEGYGPNAEALLSLREEGADVCVTVDCGTVAFGPLAEAMEAGLDMVVVDHHLSMENLPEAVAVVNPNRLDETSDQKHLAAVGVTFLLVVGVHTKLRECGWYEGKESPDLLQLLDLVALGTMCDVVPLKGVNRAFVSQGLRVMKKRGNVGIAALSDIASLDSTPNSYHLGFLLGPRINAGGRVGESYLGAKLLSTEDVDEAYSIAQKLDKYNGERKTIEHMVFENAVSQIGSGDVETPVLFARGEGWHPGVVGIVASRVTERFNRPCAIISLKDGVGKASARSVNGIDFGSAIVAANNEGLLIGGGGHAMAAGFTVEEEKIPALFDFLSARFSSNIEECAVRRIKVDGYLSLDAVNLQIAELIKKVEPFGTSNPEPRFVFSDVFIMQADVVGADHVRCLLGSNAAGGVGKTIKAMAFRCLETPLGNALLSGVGKAMNVVGRVKVNSWHGVENAEIVVDDVG